MSALGHKRTLSCLNAMSALPPKADIRESRLNVRYGPGGDIRQEGRIHDLIQINGPICDLMPI
jgi:hypothetical protein